METIEEKVFDLMSIMWNIDKYKLDLTQTIEQWRITEQEMFHFVMALEEEQSIEIPDEVSEKWRTLEDIVNTVKECIKD